ncbi:MAG: hypothetical protein ACFNXZ_12385, partial [Lautropia mirabilis]
TPARRGRKAKVEEAAAVVAAPARRGRKPKAEAAAPVAATPARRGRKTKKADAPAAQAAWPFPVGRRP